MSIATLPLEEISTEIVSGIACGKANVVPNGVLHLRPFSVTPDGRLSVFDAPRIPASVIPNGKLGFQAGDILFNNTNSVELVGKSAVFSAPLEASFSNHMTRVRVDPAKADSRYVQAFLGHLYNRRFFESRATRWVGQAAFGTAQLKAVETPLPPLEEQRRIVGLLDRAAEIRRRADAARAKARTIIPALFLDMFGDPATNPNGWPVGKLSECCDVQGGLQVTSKRSGLPLERPYLRVANVLRGTLNLSEIKLIRLTNSEWHRTRLAAGDVLIVEGHGNSNEIGRAAIWDESITDCTHQNHLIRARPNSQRLLPSYVAYFLNSHSGRQKLIGKGKTTSGLNTISTGNVKAVALTTPPLPLQTVFAEQAQRLEAFARALDAVAMKAEAIATGLSAEVFSRSEHNDQSRHPLTNVLPEPSERNSAWTSTEEVRS